MAMKKIKTPEQLLHEIVQDEEGYDPNLGFPFETPPKGAPGGQRWTYNRWDQSYSLVFDSREETWGPQCYRLVPVDLAKFVERKGYLKFDPMGQHDIKAVVTQDDKHYGQALPAGMERPIEVLHRDGIEAPKEVTLVAIPK